MIRRRANSLPGYGVTMGFTLFYLSAIVLLPIAGLLCRSFGIGWAEFWRLALAPRAVASYRLTFGASFLAGFLNAIFGTILAWVLVRYKFPGKRLIDALVDIPFALPTAVAGLTLANLFADNGWLGQFLFSADSWCGAHVFGPAGLIGRAFPPNGVKGAFSPLGVVIALTFVGLPFVVRTLQPVLAQLEREVEEAAATLGAGRLRTFVSVIGPTLLPTIITGFAMASARAIGEYGSVIFISSNLPYKTEIAPRVIYTYLEQFEMNAAMTLAIVLMGISFVMLVGINLLERWASRFQH